MNNLNKKQLLTPDLNLERLLKLKELFPDLFTLEGSLNPEEFTKIIDPATMKEKYDFNWFGKNEAKRTAFTPSKSTLIYDNKRSVNPKCSDGNLIIEGENLEALKVLLSGYREQIKCIYIDPPYNTGKDFVYSDNWDEKKEDYWEHIGVTNNGIKVDSNTDSSGRFHSNWLNLMYSRLLLARQLLKEDGIIFISIDDNEFHHLRKLCDIVFEEESFVEYFSWVKTSTPPGLSNKSRKTIEYIICFEKYRTNNKFNGELLDGGDQPLLNAGNSRRKLKFPKEKVRFNMSNGVYKAGTYDRVKLLNKIEVVNGYSKTNFELEGEFKWIQDTLDDEIRNGTTFIIKTDKFAIRFIRIDDGGFKAPTNLIKDKYISPLINKKECNVDTNEGASSELEILLKGKYFDFPKPVSLIKHLINFCTLNDDIILDFFAGSGTTGQAVIERNLEDGGNRKFILIQIPELTDKDSNAYKAGYKKISDITIERNKRVIAIIEKEQLEKPESLLPEENISYKTGFKVYKLAKSNFPRVDFEPDLKLSEGENLKLLDKYIEEKEDIFTIKTDDITIFDEVLLKNGFMLNYTLEQIKDIKTNKVYRAKDNYKECLICLEHSINAQILKQLEKHKDSIFICLEKSLDTTLKWNLKHLFGEKLIAF